MSRNDGEADGWKEDGAGGGADDSQWNGGGGDAEGYGNDSNGFGDSKGNGAGGDDACRNCGQSGHFSRECPEPKKMTGECFNCGQIGHNKSDCPNEKVDRPFTGTCKHCGVEGHRISDCPDKPKFCKNCHSDQHKTGDCTEKRKLVFADVPDLEPEQAWEKLIEADKALDLDEFRIFLKAYGQKVPDMSFSDVEVALRDSNCNIYLVALQRKISNTLTIVDLNGNKDKRYCVGIFTNPSPKRARAREAYPKSPEENLERLRDAGFVMDAFVIKCDRCGELGHMKKSCKQDVLEEVTRVAVQCALCDELGHRARDCEKPRVDRNACRNCKQPGHRANECPEPRSAEGVECRKCNEMGHFSRDCPNVEDTPRTCRNCGQEGHMSKECDQPRNPDTVTCRNCDQTGHFSRDCPLPRDYSKVQCQNCQEFGHTRVRCKKIPDDTGADGGFDTFNTDGFDAGAAAGGGDSWNTTAQTEAVGAW